MDVLVPAGDPELQREVVAGLDLTGFGVVEVGRPGLVFGLPDNALVPPSAPLAAVLGRGFGFGLDALVFGALGGERHPRLEGVYLVGGPWMRGRTRALDHRCERTC